MKDPFTPKEKAELAKAARIALAPAEPQSTWIQLGMFFDEQRAKVEPRQTSETEGLL